MKSDYLFWQTELDKNIDTFATALADGQSSAGEDTTLVLEVNCAFDEMKLLSSAFDMRLDWQNWKFSLWLS